MQIPQERLEIILSHYAMPVRFLVSAEVNYPTARGVCNVRELGHNTAVLEHVSAHNALYSLEQFGYAVLGQWLEEGRFERVISFEEYLQMRKEYVRFTQIQMRCRRKIQPNTEFPIKLQVKDHRRLYGSYHMATTYSLGKRDFFGEMHFAIIIPEKV